MAITQTNVGQAAAKFLKKFGNGADELPQRK
jgi:hypothetical protein